MKIVISHDVDHLFSHEHLRDFIVPKYLVRSILELAKGSINSKEYLYRIIETVNGKWNFIEELSNYNNSKNIKTTFFFATNKGIGLAYSAEKSKPFVEHVLKNGHKIGIHGISRDNLENIKRERSHFHRLHNQECKGVRFHYLYPNDSILQKLDAAGYTYDSSLRGDGSSRIVGNLIHFPVHIMDGDVMMQNHRYQSANLKQATVFTTERISKLIDNNVDYISILFHDRYFSDAHTTWRDWYMATVEWVQSQGIATTTYEDAVLAIRKEQSL
ncbi:MAG: polysaccharide deacetylase family protein [Thiolinea sp.]